MWEITNVSPNTANVVSDMLAIIIIWLFGAGLSFVYPYFIWKTVRCGQGVGLDDILAPPATFPEAVARFCKGQSSRLLLLGIVLILCVETFSHTAADAFMNFDLVEVGENEVRAEQH